MHASHTRVLLSSCPCIRLTLEFYYTLVYAYVSHYGVSDQNFVFLFSVSAMRTTCPSHFIFLNFIVNNIRRKTHIIWLSLFTVFQLLITEIIRGYFRTPVRYIWQYIAPFHDIHISHSSRKISTLNRLLEIIIADCHRVVRTKS